MTADSIAFRGAFLAFAGWVNRRQHQASAPAWRVFLKAHWEEIAPTDFFTSEVWTATSLRTYYVLFFIELKSRVATAPARVARPG